MNSPYLFGPVLNKFPNRQQTHQYSMNKLDGLFKRTKTKKKHLSHFGTPIHLLLASKVLPLRNDPIEADIPDVLIYLIDYLADDKSKLLI